MSLLHAIALPPVLLRSTAILRQGAAVAARLSPERFRAPAPGSRGGSVGAHLRHCIEFYRSLLGTPRGGALDYDLRPRDLALEREPARAVAALDALVEELLGLDARHLDQPLQVRHDHDGSAADAWAPSTLGRELNFLLSHTVHHYALIALLLRQDGVALPADFGVAPSTLRYQRECANEPVPAP